MNKGRLVLSLILVLAVVSKVHASWTYVFCATPDGEKWHWLKDGYDNYVTISGQWRENSFRLGRHFKYMSVSEEDYLSVNKQCPSGYVAQPADNKLSDWQLFRVHKTNGEDYYAPGKYSVLIESG